MNGRLIEFPASQWLPYHLRHSNSERWPEYLTHACSYEEVLDAPEVDAVYVPLPTAIHLQWVKAAAAKGKHILLEKPIALVIPFCLPARFNCPRVCDEGCSLCSVW